MSTIFGQEDDKMSLKRLKELILTIFLLIKKVITNIRSPSTIGETIIVKPTTHPVPWMATNKGNKSRGPITDVKGRVSTRRIAINFKA